VSYRIAKCILGLVLVVLSIAYPADLLAQSGSGSPCTPVSLECGIRNPLPQGMINPGITFDENPGGSLVTCVEISFMAPHDWDQKLDGGPGGCDGDCPDYYLGFSMGPQGLNHFEDHSGFDIDLSTEFYPDFANDAPYNGLPCNTAGAGHEFDLCITGIHPQYALPAVGSVSSLFVDTQFACCEETAGQNDPCSGVDTAYLATFSAIIQDPDFQGEIDFPGDDDGLVADGHDQMPVEAPGINTANVSPAWTCDGLIGDSYIDLANGQIYGGTISTEFSINVEDPQHNHIMSREVSVGGSGCESGDCAGGDCGAGSENVELDSVNVRISLGGGNCNEGESDGYLWIYAPKFDQFLGTPPAWRINWPGVGDLYDQAFDPAASWSVKQHLGIPSLLISPEVVVVFDWQDMGSAGLTATDLIFYRRDQYSASTGELIPGAVSFLRWNAEASAVYADPGLNNWMIPSDTEFTLRKFEGGELTPSAKYTYTHNRQPADVTFPLSEYKSVMTLVTEKDGETRTETETIWFDTLKNPVNRDYEVSEGGYSHKTSDVYTRIRQGNGANAVFLNTVTERIEDVGVTNQVTTLQYYSSDLQSLPYLSNLDPKIGHLQYIFYPDGSWEWRDYDTQHRLIEIRRPVGDQQVPWDSTYESYVAEPDAATCRRTVYEYHPTGTGPIARYPIAVEEYETDGNLAPASILTSRTEFSYAVGATFKYTMRRCENAACTDYLETVTHYASDSDFRTKEDPIAVHYPDGQMTLRIVESDGSYTDPTPLDPSQASFDPLATGEYEREFILSGLTQDKNTTAITLVPNRSTRVGRVTDNSCNAVMTESFVYTGPAATDFDRIDFTVYGYDENEHMVRAGRSNGEYETWTWSCCELLSHTAADGVVTTYEDYDINDLPETVTKLGFGGAANVVTSNDYDADGRALTTTVSGGSLSLTTSRTYEGNRLKTVTDPVTGTTTYDYPSNNEVCVTLPGNLLRETEYYIDGNIKSITGNAQVNEYYEYGIDGLDERYTKVTYGDPITGPSVTTNYDLLGRPKKSYRQGFNSVALSQEWNYDVTNGQLKSVVTKVGGTVDSVTLFQYSAFGQRTTICEDIDKDFIVDLGGPDRILDSDHIFVEVGGVWYSESTTDIYPDTATPLQAQRLRTQLTNLPSGTTAFAEGWDIHGNHTTVTVAINRANKTITTTGDVPGSTQNMISIVENGLLKSMTSVAGHLTQYEYDDLERQKRVIDPRTGASEVFYDGTTGLVTSVRNAAFNEVLFGYDAVGRRTSVTNPMGEHSYYAYNTDGQLYRVWGDVPQPIELGFDPVYRRRTTLKTFKDETVDWTQTTWPSTPGTPAVTTWNYDETTGVLVSKVDDDGGTVAYDYYDDLKLKSREWARLHSGSPLKTTYGYHADTHRLNSITYSDDTPSISVVYDRLGRPQSITDALGTHTYDYDDNTLQLLSEEIGGLNSDGNASLFSKLITRTYESTGTNMLPGRYSGVQVGPDALNPSADYAATIGYDTFGRYKTFTGPGLPDGGAQYKYLANSNLIEHLEYLDSQAAKVGGITWAYEAQRDLITSVDNHWGSGSPTNIAKFSYRNDALGRRTDRANDLPGTDNDDFDAFVYNARNELLDSARFEGLDPDASSPVSVPGFDFSYTYDPIGNRLTGTAPNGEATINIANALNEYTTINYPDVICELNETEEYLAPTQGNNQYFGASQQVSGDWMIVGESHDNTHGVNAGIVTFIRISDGATQNPTITGIGAGDQFGTSVAIDGNVAIVGGPYANDGTNDTGAAVIFRFDGTNWAAEHRIDGVAADDRFGVSVDIDGDVAVIGATHHDVGATADAGEVAIYRHNGTSWALDHTHNDSTPVADDHFGENVALDGDIVIIGATDLDNGVFVDRGSVMFLVYDSGTTSWVQEAQYFGISDTWEFGASVAVDGDYVVFGAPGLQNVYVVERQSAGVWNMDGILGSVFTQPGDRFGSSVVIDGEQIIVGAENATTEVGAFGTPVATGAAYLFSRIDGAWDEEAKLAPSGGASDYAFGGSVNGFNAQQALIGAVGRDVTVYSQPGGTPLQTYTDAGASFRFELTDSNLNNTPDRCEVVPTYDADGNLLSDDRFAYTWDAENRLVRVEEIEADTSGVMQGRKRVTYTYDFMGRRVRSLYEQENILSFMGQPPTPPWLTDSDTRYVYEGWNVVLELDGENSNAVAKQYTWGLDLSGALQGAGGVGGLLACKDHKGSGTADDVQYVYAYDANGNVMALTDSDLAGTPGVELARYDYDPYGNVVASTGTEAGNNLYRFSTKPQSGLTNLYYYGYRWYSAEWGRFINRDPLGEAGGLNLFGFVGNGPGNGVDLLGLSEFAVHNLHLGCNRYRRFFYRGHEYLGFVEYVINPDPQSNIAQDAELLVTDIIESKHEYNTYVYELSKKGIQIGHVSVYVLGFLVPGPDDLIWGAVLSRYGLKMAWNGSKWVIGKACKGGKKVVAIGKDALQKLLRERKEIEAITDAFSYIPKGKLADMIEHGDRFYPKEKLLQLIEYLRKRGVELKVGSPLVQPGDGLLITYPKKSGRMAEMHLCGKPTYLSVWHELAHYRHWKKIGDAYSELDRTKLLNEAELYVFQVLKNPRRWNELTQEERDKAIAYVLQMSEELIKALKISLD